MDSTVVKRWLDNNVIRAKPGLREFFEVENHLSRLGDRNRYAA